MGDRLDLEQYLVTEKVCVSVVFPGTIVGHEEADAISMLTLACI